MYYIYLTHCADQKRILKGYKMQDFFTIAKTDFLDTFQGAWIFPLLLIVLVFIFWKEKDDMRRLLLGVRRCCFYLSTGVR